MQVGGREGRFKRHGQGHGHGAGGGGKGSHLAPGTWYLQHGVRKEEGNVETGWQGASLDAAQELKSGTASNACPCCSGMHPSTMVIVGSTVSREKLTSTLSSWLSVFFSFPFFVSFLWSLSLGFSCLLVP